MRLYLIVQNHGKGKQTVLAEGTKKAMREKRGIRKWLKIVSVRRVDCGRISDNA